MREMNPPAIVQESLSPSDMELAAAIYTRIESRISQFESDIRSDLPDIYEKNLFVAWGYSSFLEFCEDKLNWNKDKSYRELEKSIQAKRTGLNPEDLTMKEAKAISLIPTPFLSKAIEEIRSEPHQKTYTPSDILKKIDKLEARPSVAEKIEKLDEKFTEFTNRLSKDERRFLDSIPIRDSLSEKCRKVFDEDAVTWLRYEKIASEEVRRRHLVNERNPRGIFQYLISRVTLFPAPASWLVCSSCSDGCEQCRYRGYVAP